MLLTSVIPEVNLARIQRINRGNHSIIPLILAVPLDGKPHADGNMRFGGRRGGQGGRVLPKEEDLLCNATKRYMHLCVR